MNFFGYPERPSEKNIIYIIPLPQSLPHGEGGTSNLLGLCNNRNKLFQRFSGDAGLDPGLDHRFPHNPDDGKIYLVWISIVKGING